MNRPVCAFMLSIRCQQETGPHGPGTGLEKTTWTESVNVPRAKCTLRPWKGAAKTACGLRSDASPALALHGNILTKGVRFSVQTASAGSVACRS